MLDPGAPARGITGGVVARASLFARLQADEGGVTLISAPAGSGKTVLLRSWIEASDLAPRTAWVTVDRAERDPQHFWLQVVDALRSTPASRAIDRPTATPDFDGVPFTERLLGQLGELEDPVVLVLDDLHELASPDANEQLERFVARRPPGIRLILATRHDPPLGLHRLRLTGELTELRGADLRFTLTEASELLGRSGVSLTEEAAARLQERTEGWAAALRLAAWSLAGVDDPERFVAEFSGSDRSVADYLLAEVLDRRPDEERRLLVRTSILDRVSGSLADRLLGVAGSERILLRLEASNAFVTALDASRTWFRYHQLFADLLRLELRRTTPEDIPALHAEAAAWHAERGDIPEALRHDRAAEDWTAAERRLTEHGFSLVLDGHGATVDELLAAFPSDRLRDPELLALLALRELSERSLETAAASVGAAERAAATAPAERRPRTDVALALARLALARRMGDLDTALREVGPFLGPIAATDAKELGQAGDARAAALLSLAIVELWSTRLSDAQLHLDQALALARDLGRPYVEIGCLSHLSLLVSTHSFAPGRALAEEALRLADVHGWEADPVVAIAAVSIASMDAAQARFDTARQWLALATPHLRPDTDPAGAVLVHFVRGDLLAGEGRFGEAIEAYADGERLQAVLATRHTLTGPVRASIALCQLRSGDVAMARRTLTDLADDERDLAEARVAAAAVHLVEGAPGEALEALSGVLAGEVPVLRNGTMVEALVLAASASDRAGGPATVDTVERLIERALDVAEPDGLILPFLRAPAPQLLERHPRHGTAHAMLLADVLDALGGSPPSGPRRPEVAEDLSAAELRVLRYLPSNLSASEIASELFVSTSTVKTHMRHIYDKLGAHKRTDAVATARALGLLGPSTRRS